MQFFYLIKINFNFFNIIDLKINRLTLSNHPFVLHPREPISKRSELSELWQMRAIHSSLFFLLSPLFYRSQRQRNFSKLPLSLFAFSSRLAPAEKRREIILSARNLLLLPIWAWRPRQFCCSDFDFFMVIVVN